MSRARDLADSADLNFDDGTLVIDSGNNRVGIGTNSPTAPLHIYSSSANRPLIESNSTSQAGLILKNTDREFRILNGSSSLSVYDSTSGSEAMRIDSSGNLLVGKTDISLGVAGHRFDPSGFQYLTRNNATPLYINRLSGDGELVSFRKDGTTVGTIGVNSDRFFIGDSSFGGFVFANGVSTILPSGSSGALSDNTHDIGNSGNRFKDLYLSGGVYLGGTGSANKLTDYEEGTWTASFYTDVNGGGTLLGTKTATYTKIGRTVHVSYYADNVGSPTRSVLGLPFTMTGYASGITADGVNFYTNEADMSVNYRANDNSYTRTEFTYQTS